MIPSFPARPALPPQL